MNHSGGAHCRGRKALAYRRRNYEPPQSPFLHRKFENKKTTGVVQASARKLAAGLWQLRFSEISWGQKIKFNSHPSDPSPPQPQLESSLAYPKCASEKATKWDPARCSGESDYIYQFYSHMKLLEDCQITTRSIVLTLNAELTQARLCIRELEATRQSFKKKVKHFFRKLEEERMSWQSGARQKSHAIEYMKEELGRERKRHQKMENVNTNLIDQLAGAKMSAQQFMKKYKEEKKRRKFMEEVSNELAAQIGEDKAKAEVLKKELVRILEEAKQEKKMMQLAAVWREERVQMKLMDAKIALEDKYRQLNKLITDVETFLRSGFGTLDMAELRKAELILQAVESLNVHDIEEFSYLPPKSDEIFSVFKDLRQCEGNEREIEPCVRRCLSSHNSTVHPVSPEDNVFNKSSLPMQLNCLSGYDSCYEDAGWDSMSHAEDHQGSCNSVVARNNPINKVGEAKMISSSRSECNGNVGQYSPGTEISEVCSTSEKQSKHKTSSVSHRGTNGGELCKIVLDEGERRLSNGITSGRGTNAYRGLFQRVGQWIPTDIANPHIARGMKGSIEWPRTIQTNCSKAKLLEAKIESQKSVLRRVLKQKIR